MTSPRLNSIVKLFETCRYKHDLYTVFGDWCECSAISMSNAVDLVNFEKREARYVEIARKYGSETMATFSKIFGEVVMALEEKPQDILGMTFHALELHNKARGQFFTPHPICQLMARIIAGGAEDMQKAIAERGFMLAQEPAVGSGAMIVALAEAILEAGFNYQQLLHVTAVDIDPRAVHMAYIQFSLLHIPATVIVGDSLAMRFREESHTMAHAMGGWSTKLRRARENAGAGVGEEERALPVAVPRRAAVVAAGTAAPKQGASAPAVEGNGQLRLF
ncbi:MULTISPECIES: N-6 DNA methylase [unclassified Shinella]|uniref:N-6 DNA methylase n=1 Tax=unclassified Shinella TaxID=2643062 RepID=UPI00225CEAE5|nr:N-6 DNA methylase [Shinella sp. YE25]MDC7259785.1 N-6 DNA methylase [Shinella sp. YE25]CAI0334035.1 Restriction endonuclease subunit M [Rhizobiaceae bacterium]CAK7261683.1 Restriction endonuclease subunit M [Shinella sp. WSC3-e]